MSRSSTKTDSVASDEIRRSITDVRKHQPQSVMLQNPLNFSLQLLQNAGY